MRVYPGEYLYAAGRSAVLDAQFQEGTVCGKVKTGTDTIFFKSGFKWYAVPVSRVQRVFRRMDMVYGKLCCGGRTYDIQMLVLIDDQGRELEVHIGDDMKDEAERLYAAIQETHPQLLFGKP